MRGRAGLREILPSRHRYLKKLRKLASLRAAVEREWPVELRVDRSVALAVEVAQKRLDL
jgi:hypothetical protein